MKDDRTSRILLIFHFFYHCREVELQEIIAYLQFQRISASQKTISRDIQFLKQAGLVQARYSRKYKAYVPLKGNKHFVPEDEEYHLLGLPKDHAKKLYMEKVIRLCTLMTKMIMKGVENPIDWYRDRYPMLSDRTRQRDFQQLKKIGYKISYVPENEVDTGRYCYFYPDRVYDELDFYRPWVWLLHFLDAVDSSHMPESAKLIWQSLKNGTYHRHGTFTKREVSRILDMRIVEEQSGMGVSFICDNGMEYRFATIDEDYSDYRTPEELLQAATEYAQKHDAKTTLNFVNAYAVQYYEQELSNGTQCYSKK